MQGRQYCYPFVVTRQPCARKPCSLRLFCASIFDDLPVASDLRPPWTQRKPRIWWVLSAPIHSIVDAVIPIFEGSEVTSRTRVARHKNQTSYRDPSLQQLLGNDNGSDGISSEMVRKGIKGARRFSKNDRKIQIAIQYTSVARWRRQNEYEQEIAALTLGYLRIPAFRTTRSIACFFINAATSLANLYRNMRHCEGGLDHNSYRQ